MPPDSSIASIAPLPPSVVADPPTQTSTTSAPAPGDRGCDELAGAVGGRGDRVAIGLGDEREAGGLRDLDDRRAAVLEEHVAGLELAPEQVRAR